MSFLGSFEIDWPPPTIDPFLCDIEPSADRLLKTQYGIVHVYKKSAESEGELELLYNIPNKDEFLTDMVLLTHMISDGPL